MSDNEKVEHKSKKKSKKSKKDEKKVQQDPEADQTQHDEEEHNKTEEKLNPEEVKEDQDQKLAQARKCYVEGGICISLLLLAFIFIYLFEYTDVIRQRPVKEIYTKNAVAEKPPEYETVFLQNNNTCMLTLTEKEKISNVNPKDFSPYGGKTVLGVTREECETQCMKISACSFYQYHIVTDPPLLATKDCLYNVNATSTIIGSSEYPKGQFTNDDYSCWIKTKRVKGS